ncbi:hypothetical protein HF888_14335 [Bermanella marisrubri]|uniref:Uncharacterized protein n=1 Tax=Bermanella marisrubri TaxID=207949 RepID=Q1MY57_9GAMM|nr:DUF1302 family protein [Bermanella marisrubri]EAT10903.1 hypothetical protein RED65_12670 [Oceanobacter sp. RED65] [Bermanella marisrubri]QIZ85330.1 hypothetical protein HF888_14335 [Bermanella marisrubri]
MYVRFYITLCLMIGISNCVFAQLGYQTEVEWITYPEIEETDDESFVFGRVNLDYQHIINHDMRFFTAISFRRSDPGDTRDQERLSELYIDYRHLRFDLRSGLQYINWGRADIVNPLDFSPQDFRDPLDDDNEDLPVAGFNLSYYLETSQIQWIVLPYFIDSELPKPESIWFSNLPSQTPLGQDIQYTVVEANQPETGIDNWQTGVKWSHRGRGFDWAVSYFYGWNDVPLFYTSNQFINSTTVKVFLEPTFYRQHIIGFDSAWLIEDYTFRSELAYKHTSDNEGEDPYIDDPYLHMVLGIDRTFQNIIFEKDLFLLLEYSYQHAITDIQYQTNDFDHIFENTLFTRFGMDNLPKWELQIDLAFDLASEGYFVRPQLSYEWFDNFKTQISIEFLEGNSNSFFGANKENKAIRFRIIKEGIF